MNLAYGLLGLLLIGMASPSQAQAGRGDLSFRSGKCFHIKTAQREPAMIVENKAVDWKIDIDIILRPLPGSGPRSSPKIIIYDNFTTIAEYEYDFASRNIDDRNKFDFLEMSDKINGEAGSGFIKFVKSQKASTPDTATFLFRGEQYITSFSVELQKNDVND